MRAWRHGLIAAYAALGLIGASLLLHRHRVAGLAVFAAGAACMAVHLALQRSDQRRERAARAAWVAEIERSADDLSLASYGIPTVAELAQYHDAAGRAAVLEALRTLPPGERSLVVAARTVDPEASWD